MLAGVAAGPFLPRSWRIKPGGKRRSSGNAASPLPPLLNLSSRRSAARFLPASKRAETALGPGPASLATGSARLHKYFLRDMKEGAEFEPPKPFLVLRIIPDGSPRKGGPVRKSVALARTEGGLRGRFKRLREGPSTHALRYRSQPTASGPPQAPMSERLPLGYQDGQRIPSEISPLPASIQGEPAARR